MLSPFFFNLCTNKYGGKHARTCKQGQTAPGQILEPLETQTSCQVEHKQEKRGRFRKTHHESQRGKEENHDQLGVGPMSHHQPNALEERHGLGPGVAVWMEGKHNKKEERKNMSPKFFNFRDSRPDVGRASFTRPSATVTPSHGATAVHFHWPLGSWEMSPTILLGQSFANKAEARLCLKS